MPVFEIEKDGATYQVDAPDHATAASAFGALNFQSAQPAFAIPPAPTGAIIHGADGVSRVSNMPALSTTRTGDAQTDTGRAATLAHRVTNDIGPARRALMPFFQGLSFGWGDEAVSGLGKLVGGDYAAMQEWQRQELERQRAEHPVGSPVSQVAGGALGALGLMRGGATLMAPGMGLAKMAGAGAAEGAGYGALFGAGDAASLSEAPQGAAKGAAAGFVLGAIAPPFVAGVSKVSSPVLNAIAARRDPATAASRAIMERMRSAGVTPQMAQQQISEAAADGQPMFTLADAMGHAGGRAMTPVTRTPNDARQMVVDFLMGRQTGQGGRVASHLQDASGSSLTAAQNKSMMEASRAAAAERNYAPVKADNSAIDVSNPVDVANRAISPMASAIGDAQGWQPTNLAARSGIEAGEGVIRDPIRSAIKEARSYLAADNLTVTNVEKAFRAKTNIDQMIAAATDKKQGALVSELLPMQKALDDALARTSKQYAFARDSYKAASQPIDAIDLGRGLAAPRVRSEDALNTFGALPDKASQDAARIGYFDPLISRAEGTAGTMTNSVRPLSSEKYKTELPQFAAPGKGDQLTRRLDREQKMFETNSAGLGGSRTADNLADAADSSMLDTSMIGNIMSGNFKGAGLQLALKAGNKFAGRSPAVLDNMGKMLTATDPSSIGKMLALAQMQQQASDKVRAQIAAMLMGVGIPAATRLLP